ncbi:MAG: tetratricopeptide repeat protein [Endomicrobia bacterium]|nr:tetratricopeptide repeat protein [Endomicrobiia bacterium]
MIRNAFKVMFFFVFVTAFCCVVYGAAAQPKQKKTEIFCVGDSIVLGNKGSYIYSDLLQMLFDKKYGTSRVSVYNYSFFDMNTTQCLRLITDLLSKPDSNTEFIVIMAGEANYYNLSGFTDHLFSIGLYKPQNAFISENDIDSVKKLNTGVASIYNSPAAYSKKASLYYAFSSAYRSIAGSSPKEVGGYVPKVIPSFLALSEDNLRNADHVSFGSRYKMAWGFINAGKFKEAEAVLKEMLRNKPLDSSLYYALGSLYLMEDNLRISEALKMFQEGILINPFDKANQCYKGLSVMYMTYDGRIISEILYFARVMKSYLGERIPEINSITAINTNDYDAKVRMVNDWIIRDIKEIDSLCKKKSVQLLVVEYPLNAKVSAFLRDALSYGSIIFVDKPDSTNIDPSQSGSIYAETAKNVMEVIDQQIKK